MSGASMQKSLSADFADAQLLMIEFETVQNLRSTRDPMNPVPLNGGLDTLELRVYKFFHVSGY
jgi:hypothetical protein